MHLIIGFPPFLRLLVQKDHQYRLTWILSDICHSCDVKLLISNSLWNLVNTIFLFGTFTSLTVLRACESDLKGFKLSPCMILRVPSTAGYFWYCSKTELPEPRTVDYVMPPLPIEISRELSRQSPSSLCPVECLPLSHARKIMTMCVARVSQFTVFGYGNSGVKL